MRLLPLALILHSRPRLLFPQTNAKHAIRHREENSNAAHFAITSAFVFKFSSCSYSSVPCHQHWPVSNMHLSIYPRGQLQIRIRGDRVSSGAPFNEKWRSVNVDRAASQRVLSFTNKRGDQTASPSVNITRSAKGRTRSREHERLNIFPKYSRKIDWFS